VIFRLLAVGSVVGLMAAVVSVVLGITGGPASRMIQVGGAAVYAAAWCVAVLHMLADGNRRREWAARVILVRPFGAAAYLWAQGSGRPPEA